jgi:uncharacterized protein
MENSAWASWEARFVAFNQRDTAVADAAHDPEHIRRVVQNAKTLAQIEGGALAVVIPAAWLHDCVHVPKDSPQRSLASQLAAEAAVAFLQTVHYPAQYLPEIAHAIAAHSFSANIRPDTFEAQIVQDADRLDALGAVGIARCLMLGGEMGKPLYHLAEPLPQTRPPDDGRYVIDHFYRKLFKLADLMNTPSGRQEALRRTAFMRDYLAELAREIEPAALRI